MGQYVERALRIIGPRINEPKIIDLEDRAWLLVQMRRLEAQNMLLDAITEHALQHNELGDIRERLIVRRKLQNKELYHSSNQPDHESLEDLQG